MSMRVSRRAFLRAPFAAVVAGSIARKTPGSLDHFPLMPAERQRAIQKAMVFGMAYGGPYHPQMGRRNSKAIRD